MGKPVFSLPPPRSFPLSFSYLFFCQQVSFGIQSGQYVLNQQFSFSYATLFFKPFCSCLATESLPVPSDSGPLAVCIRVPFPELSEYPAGTLTGSLSPLQAWQPSRFPISRAIGVVMRRSPGRQHIIECSCETGSILYKKRRNQAFDLGNGTYVIKSTGTHSVGGKELDREPGGIAFLLRSHRSHSHTARDPGSQASPKGKLLD